MTWLPQLQDMRPYDSRENASYNVDRLRAIADADQYSVDTLNAIVEHLTVRRQQYVYNTNLKSSYQAQIIKDALHEFRSRRKALRTSEVVPPHSWESLGPEASLSAQSTCQFCGAQSTCHKGWCPVILPPGEIDKL